MVTRPAVTRLALVSLAAMLVSLAPAPVTAGDLYERDYSPRHGSAYDDPRYADLYGDEPPPAPRYVAPYAPPPPPVPAPYYGDRYNGAPEPYRQRYGYLEPLPYPPRFDHAPRYTYRQEHDGCVPRPLIRRRLVEQGWRDFDDLEIRDRVGKVTARGRDGRYYRLVVDRCSGEIVRARPADDHYGAYSGPRGFHGRTY